MTNRDVVLITDAPGQDMTNNYVMLITDAGHG